MALAIKHLYQFGDFAIDPDQKVLLRRGKPVSLAPKVFDTLQVLVENGGRIMAKEELMNRLWPETFVEEANLTFNVQQLRRTLGDSARRPKYIETITRRGYRFKAKVEEIVSDSAGTQRPMGRRLDTCDLQPSDAGNARRSEAPVQESEQTMGFGAHHRLDLPSNGVGPRFSVAVVLPANVRKSTLAVTAGLLTLLGVLSLIWRFSVVGGNKKVDGEPALASTLKFDMLTGTGESRHVAISPDGKYLAYTRDFEGKSAVWLRQLDSNTNIEIVPVLGPIGGLAFANNGEYLYFVRGDPAALFRVSLLGGMPSKLVDNVDGNFSISSDDSQIAFIRQVINPDGEREYSLIISGSDGDKQRTVLVGTHPNDLNVPVWSPDNRSVICAYGNSNAGGENVSLIEVETANGQKRGFSSDRFVSIAKIACLPHKSGLIMSARRMGQLNNQLWRISYPGMEISQMTEGLFPYLDISVSADTGKAVASKATRVSDIWAGSSREPQNLKRLTQAMDEFCWTPKGQLVFLSMASGKGDLWLMQPDGTQQRQVTVNAMGGGVPSVTPDNRRIAFISNRTGAFQVWRIDIDGSGETQLTDGNGKFYPAISPDGKWVLYNTTDDWHLWRVSIDGGEPVRLTDYFALRPSVSPDGKMIACVGRNESKREILILPFEGGRPLKRIDFTGGGFSNSRIQWTPDGKALIHTNELNGVRAIIQEPLGSGRAETIADLGHNNVFDFGYSYDGQLLAVTRGEWKHDIVLISGLDRF